MSFRYRRALCIAAALSLASTTVAGCGGRQTDTAADTGKSGISCTVAKETRVAIATGNTGGVYYVVGNALATQISAATGGKLKATAAETGASVQNIQQLDAEQYQVAFSLFDTATDAFAGKGAFEGKPAKIRALGRLYDNATHVVVRNGAGINSMADMKGKRISTGSPKSGTEVIARRLLQAAGLDPDKDIQPQRLDLTKTVEGMKGGTIDGFVWSGGLPTSGVTDLFTTAAGKVKFIDISPLLPAMQKLNVAYQQGTIPAATYKTPADVPTIVVPNVLLVREDLDADIACVLTKTLLDKRDALIQASAAAKGITLANIRKTEPVPLHRGAVKALDDAGAAK
jgi:TRAP transporter TAXI family solute receptor